MLSSRVALNAYERIAHGWKLGPDEGAKLIGVSAATVQTWLAYKDGANIPDDGFKRVSHLVWIWAENGQTSLPAELQSAGRWFECSIRIQLGG